MTIRGVECQFPYLHSDGQMKHECFMDPAGDRFKSWCPTRVDPGTRRPDPDSLQPCSYSCPLTKYHTHSELIRDLNDMAFNNTDRAEIFDLGRSQRGDPLYGIRYE